MALGWEDDARDARADRARRLPAAGYVAAACGLALAALLVPLAWLAPIAAEHAIAPASGAARTLLAHAVIALGLCAGAVGLLLRRPWGWCALLLCAAANALYQGKLAWFYARAIRWEHPRAPALGVEAALRYGLPALLAIAIALCLCARPVRVAVGISAPPRARRGRRVSAGSSRTRSPR